MWWPFRRQIVIEDLKRIQLLPDDIVVLKLRDHASEYSLKQLSERLKAIFGSERRTIILDNNTALELYNDSSQDRERRNIDTVRSGQGFDKGGPGSVRRIR